MPVLRYLLFTGGALLALLFLADWYWPTTTSVANADQVQETSIDRDFLRIRSAQKWPQKIVFDTNIPTIASPRLADAHVPPPAVATPVAAKPAPNAFAEMKPAVQPQGPARKAIAKHRTSKPLPARFAAYPTAPAWSWNW